MLREHGCERLQGCELSDWRLQINDRFGSQPRNRCGADVFDPPDQPWLQQTFDAKAFRFAEKRPLRVGIDDLDGFISPGRNMIVGTHC